MTAYYPLAHRLSRICDSEPSRAINGLIGATGKSSAQIVLNYCLSKEGVVAIPRGNSEKHIADNCGASGWRLSEEQLHLLDTKIPVSPLDGLRCSGAARCANAPARYGRAGVDPLTAGLAPLRSLTRREDERGTF